MKVLRISSVVATAIAMATVCLAPAVTAAEPGVRYVAFGDSMTVAPHGGGGGVLGLPTYQQQPKTVPAPNPLACARSNFGWPSIMAAQWGLGAAQTGDWADYACQSATTDTEPVNNLRTQIDQSIHDGMLGPATRLVTIQISANDVWHPGQVSNYAYTLAMCLTDIVRGCDYRTDPDHYIDADAITGPNLAHRLTAGIRGDMIGAIRAAAPHAQIRLVGYEDQNPPPGVPFTCFSVFGLRFQWPQYRTAYAHKLTDNIENAMSAAADQIGIGFWSLRPVGIGRDLCAPATHWTGLADPGEPFFPFHPNLQAHFDQGSYLNGIRLAEGIA
ncbi:GDSL-type esterase/lipase family protein [Nocardia brasiliensis]|uniref:GDSL-type esterase/lipase family protein n=1 Tax=Nocardia brasiliensis TaxID=37326 RepID=UPI002458414A|nr:GDSL-type esterase/lipase family protein [Nocardia brasiliensis]